MSTQPTPESVPADLVTCAMQALNTVDGYNHDVPLAHSVRVMLAAVLDAQAREQQLLTVSAGTPSPLCRESANFPGGRTVTCSKLADHTSPWHRRDADSWKVLYGVPHGRRPRTTPKDSK